MLSSTISCKFNEMESYSNYIEGYWYFCQSYFHQITPVKDLSSFKYQVIVHRLVSSFKLAHLKLAFCLGSNINFERGGDSPAYNNWLCTQLSLQEFVKSSYSFVFCEDELETVSL